MMRESRKGKGSVISSLDPLKIRNFTIVFSQNYASSLWCLVSDDSFMECQKTTEHTSYPVFYDVEPTEVRNQIGAVGEAFAKHVGKEDVGRWRDALKEAASLAGWELKNTLDGRHIFRKHSQFTHLRELRLEGSIPEVPKDLCRLQCLEDLTLSMKEIKHLPKSICTLKHLKSLELNYCRRLEQLPENICRLECLEELHITNCTSLLDIPNSICEMKRLKRLHLSSCHLVAKLPKELGCLDCLVELHLTDCRSLRYIPNSICKMKYLKTLNLSYCSLLEKLPEELGCLECLKELNIDSVGISCLPHTVFKLKGLCIVGSRQWLDCMVLSQKTTEHTAYPVFYDVEPTEVRNQSGAVGVAFAKHEKSHVLPLDCLCCILASCCNGSSSSLNEDVENEDDVGRWRNALKAAAGLAGMELKNTCNGYSSLLHEAKFIQQIVQDISPKLNVINVSVDGKLVGMETRIKNVVSSLDTGSDDVRMIGIRGMGGGGKTTLARAIFNHISTSFESKSFVENVREVSKGSGLKELQKQILSAVLNDKTIDVTSVLDGKDMMKERMRSRKVLLVLDDLDDIEQLEALSCDLTWFKPGSRIIITTRDEQVLIAHRFMMSICYHMKKQFASSVVIRVLESCGFNAQTGLRVLKKKSLITVSDALTGLTFAECLGLHDQIEEMGRNIVRRMHPDEPCKHSRLWIKEEIEDILVNEVGTEASKSIKLKNTNLHTTIIMKGLRKMRELRYLYVDNGYRKWKVDEVRQYLPDALRSLYWHGYPFCCLPKTFQANKLVNLEMPWSSISQLWKGGEKKGRIMVLNKIRFLDLTCSKLRTFDLRLTPRLEKLNLGGCNDFVELHLHVECPNLKSLDLSGSKLKTFDLRMTPYLEELNLGGCNDFVGLHNLHVECPNLKSLDLSGSKLRTFDLRMTPHLEKLNLGGCKDFVELHLPFECPNLKFLNRMVLSLHVECPNLKSLDLSGSKLRTFDLRMTPHLEKLNLGGCNDFVELHLPFECPNLKFLNLSSSKVSNLNLGMTPHLRRQLTLEGSIPEVHEDLYLQSENLKFLTLSMKEIKHLPDSICMLKQMKSLKISSSPQLHKSSSAEHLSIERPAYYWVFEAA
ncbi:hypothetical protein L1987_87632 [Smallanthus sonchifolius]|nr:hypothetical protein L1987_87632 [Smallanthus sonchifolius]